MKLLHLMPVFYEMTPDDFGFDYTQKIPTLSIAAMIAGLILVIAVPIFLFVYTHRRYQIDPQALLYGLLAYMLGSYILPTVVAMGAQFLDSVTGIFSAVPPIYYLVVTLATIGFTWLFVHLFLKHINKKMPLTLGSAILFAISMILFPILTNSITYLGQYLFYSLTVNKSGLYDIVANMITSEEATAESIQSFLDAMGSLITETPSYFLLMAIDNLVPFFIQSGVCLLYAGMACGFVNTKRGIQRIFIIEGVFALSMYLRYTFISNVLLAVLLYIVVAAISVALAATELKQTMPDEFKKLFSKADPSFKNKNNKNGTNNNSGHKMPKIVMPKD